MTNHNLQTFSQVASLLTSNNEHNPAHPEIQTANGNKNIKIQIGSVDIVATEANNLMRYKCKGETKQEAFQDPNLALERGIGLALVLHEFERNGVEFEGFNKEYIVGKIKEGKIVVDCNEKYNLSKATMVRVGNADIEGGAEVCPPIRCVPDYMPIMADSLITAIPAAKEALVHPAAPPATSQTAKLENEINKALGPNGKCRIREEEHNVVGILEWENEYGAAVYTYKTNGIENEEDCKVQSKKNSEKGAMDIFSSENFEIARNIVRDHLNTFSQEQAEDLSI